MIHEVTSAQEFNDTLNTDSPVIYNFFNNRCGPHKTISLTIEDLAEQYSNTKVYKIDTDKFPEIAQSQGIKAIPTLKRYKNGEAVEEVDGPDLPTIQDFFAKKS